MPVNRISATLTLQGKQEILKAYKTIREKMPFLIGLTPKERQSLPKTGNANLPFVIKARNFANEHVGVLSREFDLDEFNRDAAMFESLTTIEQELTVVSELVTDTLIAAGIDGLDNVMDDMSRRFARKMKGKLPSEK